MHTQLGMTKTSFVHYHQQNLFRLLKIADCIAWMQSIKKYPSCYFEKKRSTYTGADG